MPRPPGIVNNEFLATESPNRSASVLCRHCRKVRVAKSSSKRKVAHLKRCAAYRDSLGDSQMPSFDVDGADDEVDEVQPRPVKSKKGFVDAVPYRWPIGGPIKPDNTALMVIDMQRDFCEPGGLLAHLGHPVSAARSIIPPILKLLHLCRVASFPVYHVRHSHRHDLSTFSYVDHARLSASVPPPANRRPTERPEPTALPMPGSQGPLGHFLLRQSPGTDPVVELCPHYHEVMVDHPKSSAFAFTDLDLLLRNRNIQNLVFVGLDVNGSIVSTVRDATDRRFDCLLVQGCIARVSSTIASTEPPEICDPTTDLTLSEDAARAALDTILPPCWRSSSGTGTIATHAVLMSALADLAPRAPAPPQETITHTSPYMAPQTLPPMPPPPPQPAPVHAPATTQPFTTVIAPPPSQQQPLAVAKSIPGGRAGAGGRRGRGINDPIFYTPPKGGIPHPRRPGRILANRMAALRQAEAAAAALSEGGSSTAAAGGHNTDKAVMTGDGGTTTAGANGSEVPKGSGNLEGLMAGIVAEVNGNHNDGNGVNTTTMRPQDTPEHMHIVHGSRDGDESDEEDEIVHDHDVDKDHDNDNEDDAEAMDEG